MTRDERIRKLRSRATEDGFLGGQGRSSDSIREAGYDGSLLLIALFCFVFAVVVFKTLW